MDCVLYLSTFYAVFALAVCSSKVVEREITILKKRAFHLTSEVGVTPRGRTSFVFQVKSCDTAIIALSNIQVIKKNRGRYFLFYLGRNYNTQISLLDSCFGCPPKAVVKKRVLSCNVFQPFWLKWNNRGTVRMGVGRKVGQNTLITYTSLRPFLVSFSQVTSLRPPTVWKFFLKKNAAFLAPNPDGSTLLTLKENVAVGDVVYEIVVRPAMEVILISSCHFKLSGNKIQINESLDFEKERHHILLLRTKDLNITVTLTVLVDDVNDEIPEVVLRKGVHIPEELPVGFIVGDVFEAKDIDAGDILSYSLEGADRSYLHVSQTGQIQIRRRIDRDGPNSRHQLNNLHLVVKDSANHTSAKNLSLTISDINDNKPMCIPAYKSIHVNSMTNDKPIVRVLCTDLDQDGRDSVLLHIDSSFDGADYNGTFWLSGTDLFANVDLLRKDTLWKRKMCVINLLAEDTPVNGLINTANIVILINLDQDNSFIPQWVSPRPIDGNRFPDIIISEALPAGTILQHFCAQHKGSMSHMAYRISSAARGDGKTSMRPFHMEESTGLLRTVADLDSGTNTPLYYDIIITATDFKHTIRGRVKVKLKRNSHFQQRFIETLCVVSINNLRNLTKLALQLNHDSNITLKLTDSNRRYFGLSSYLEKWYLVLLPEIEPLEYSDIPSVIILTTIDHNSPPRTSYVMVIITDLPCSVPISYQTSLTTSQSTLPLLLDRKNESPPVAPLVHPQTYRAQSTAHHTTPVCLPNNGTVQKSSNFRFHLMLLCAGEGLLIGMIVLLLLAILCCRIWGALSGREKSKHQCARAESLLHSNLAQSTMKRLVSNSRSFSPSLVCEVDIIEETTRVHHKKIMVNPAYMKTPASSQPAVCDRSKTKAIVSTLNKEYRNNLLNSNTQITTKRGTLELGNDEILPGCESKSVNDSKIQPRYHPSMKDIGIQVVLNHKSELFSDTKQLLEQSSDPNFLSAHKTDTVQVKTEMTKDEMNLNSCTFPDRDRIYSQNVNTWPSIFTKNASIHQDHEDEFHKVMEVDLKETSTQTNCLSKQSCVIDSGPDAGGNNVEKTCTTNCTLLDYVKPNSVADRPDDSNALPLACISPICDACQTRKQPGNLIVITNMQNLSHDNKSLSEDDEDSDNSQYSIHQDMQPLKGKAQTHEQLFSYQDDSCLHSEDILEVDRRELKKLMVSHENNVSKYEASIKPFPQSFSSKIPVVHLPRSYFLDLISCRSKHCCCNVDEVVEVMASTFGHKMVRNEAWFHPVATCHNKGTIFLTRTIFIQFLCYFNLKIVQLSVEKKNELDKNGSTSDVFWEENIMATSATTGSVYINQLSLLELANRTPQDSNFKGADSFQNELLSVSLNQLADNNNHVKQQNIASCRNELLKSCIAVDPLTGLLYLYRNVYTNVTNISLNTTDNISDCRNDVVAMPESLVAQLMSENSKGIMMFQSYVLHKYALAFNETCKQFYFWQSHAMDFLSSVEKHGHKFEQFDKRPKCKYSVHKDPCRSRRALARAVYEPFGTEQKWCSPCTTRRSVLTVTDNVDSDEDVKHLAQIQLRKPRKNNQKSAKTWSWKKNRKIKPWKKEVRQRLYVTPVENKSPPRKVTKEQNQVYPENENDTLSSTKIIKKRKRKTKNIIQ